MTTNNWKADIPDEVRNLAQQVIAALATAPPPTLSARGAAICMMGVFRLAVSTYGIEDAQRACVDLVRHRAAWASRFGNLPRGGDGSVPTPVAMLAIGVRGIMAIAGPDNLRAAMAFWACEEDTAALQRLAG